MRIYFYYFKSNSAKYSRSILWDDLGCEVSSEIIFNMEIL